MKDLRPVQVWILIQALLLATVLAQSTKIVLDDCKQANNQMACFASSMCLSNDADQNLLYSPSGSIKDDCKAVLKIRQYAKNYWLVVMQSLDPTIDTIFVEHNGDLLLSCKSGKAMYKTVEKGLINKPETPLKCEFLVEDSLEILPSSNKEISISTNKDIATGEANIIANKLNGISLYRAAAAAAQPPDGVKVAAPAAAAGAPEAPSSPAAQPPNAPGAGGEPKSLESKSNTSKKANEAKAEPKEDKPMTNEEIRERADKMIKEAQQLKDMADGVPEKPGPPPTTLQSTDDATHGGTVMMMDGDKLVPVDMARTTAGPAAPAAKAAPKK